MREKEKGEWKNLTLDEKKQLYRASFRLTYAEMEAPSGRWKSYFGWAMLWQACALWLFMAFYYASKLFVFILMFVRIGRQFYIGSILWFIFRKPWHDAPISAI